jgi:DNA-binding NtrC family response regulator
MRGVVFVVDDHAQTRRALWTLLRDLGYEVVTAATSEEALRYIYSEEACDVILADIVMPGMWGNVLAQHAQAARPGLPVILLSGDRNAIASALEGGVFALEKPVSSTRLAAVLDEALGPSSVDGKLASAAPPL